MRSCAHKGEASGREASPQSTAKDAAAFTDKAPLVYVFGERVGVIDCADTRPAAGGTAGGAPGGGVRFHRESTVRETWKHHVLRGENTVFTVFFAYRRNPRFLKDLAESHRKSRRGRAAQCRVTNCS
jgi:hypothetical protein